MIPGSRRRHYLASVSVFLVTAALIAGMAGCGGDRSNITQVDAGYDHTVGLKDDGTVVAVGNSGSGQSGPCDVGNWTGITQVAAGRCHTVGLKDDGTLVAVGDNESGQCDVGNWTDITQVTAGYDHTV